jgi:hypothetical protein
MERKKLIKRKIRRDSGYILVHRQLGVFLGADGPILCFSNIESGGRVRAPIVPEGSDISETLERIKDHFDGFDRNGYFLKPVRRRKNQMFLSMEECVELGIPRWSEVENLYFSSMYH